MINHKVVQLHISRVVKFSIAMYFTKLLLNLLVKNFKSVNISQNCRQEVRLHFGDRKQRQFPVTLMTQMRIIDHSVGYAVRIL